ncbi:MAG: nucleotide-binding universal stress UspA family protein [Natronomonas sp.]|jgi:nucleotide-binding universal stress UspA family protein|uniref:universal stress protein n=1 Tax=Natronomonas sp. TaxID=2184060 RepID=UPI003989A625
MHVLVPIDGSDASMRALDEAFESEPMHVTALTVIDPTDPSYVAPEELPADAPATYPGASDAWWEAARDQAKQVCTEARERDPGVPLETEIEEGDPADIILSYVDEADVDAVVLGSHGHGGYTDATLGTVADEVSRKADTTVTLVR